MGLFWDLIQQSQISRQESRAASLQERVARLEKELDETRLIQRRLLDLLEREFGRDLDGDGKVA